jgi:putative ABC transport system substrate-binding protein
MQFNQLKRREFITLLGCAALLPTVARAQQPTRPAIGFLGTATPSTWSPYTIAFTQRLRVLGWIEGQNVAIEVRWAEGRTERFREIAAEFIQRKVDVIVTSGAAVATVKQATSTIPIVFAVANDPLGTGLVPSLARPGGNITGSSNQAADLDAKRLEILREVVPSLSLLAIVGNVGYPAAVLEMEAVETIARKLGIDVARIEIPRAPDIASAIMALKGRAQALYVVSDPLVGTSRVQINILAVGAQLATMHSVRDYAEAGGLMSYGPNYSDLFRRAADYVDKILRGARPGDLPVEQPTKFDLVINLATAKALGLTVPDTLLARADEVIE